MIFFWEAVEGPLLDISSASFVKAKANSEISGFGKGCWWETQIGKISTERRSWH